MNTPDHIKEIRFEKKYPGFLEFAQDCRWKVLRHMLTAIENLYKSDQKVLRLAFYSTINGFPYDFALDILRDDTRIIIGWVRKDII